MAQQWTDAQRIALSDAVIENINLEETEKRVRELNNLFIKNQCHSRKKKTAKHIPTVKTAMPVRSKA